MAQETFEKPGELHSSLPLMTAMHSSRKMEIMKSGFSVELLFIDQHE